MQNINIDFEHPSPDPDRLVPFSSAIKIVGVSRAQIYRLIGDAKFPQPVKIGRNNYFSERELQRWISTKLAARTTGSDHAQ